MNENRDIWISARAYALWEENGRLDGSDHEHWLQAVGEFKLMMQTRASHDGAEILASEIAKKRVSRSSEQQSADSIEN